MSFVFMFIQYIVLMQLHSTWVSETGYIDKILKLTLMQMRSVM